IIFAPRRTAGYAAAVRISSDIVQYSLADYAGTLIDRFEEARDHAGQPAPLFAAALLAGLDKLALRSRLDRRQVLAISVSSKGLVDPAVARLVWSPVLGGQQIDFAALFAGRWRAKVFLSNETLLVAHALAARMERSGGGGAAAL